MIKAPPHSAEHGDPFAMNSLHQSGPIGTHGCPNRSAAGEILSRAGARLILAKQASRSGKSRHCRIADQAVNGARTVARRLAA